MEENKRSIGPVTVNTVAAAALTTCVCWILSSNGIETPTEVQGAITTIFVLIAGYATKPLKKGRRSL